MGAQNGTLSQSESMLGNRLRDYYRDPSVRQRISEFLGSAVYITGNDGSSEISPPARVSALREYLDAGLEVERSLWDHNALIADIDIEYENFDFRAEAWLNPVRSFALQQPTLAATLRILYRAGIVPLTLLSGRGYHMVWSVSQDSTAFARLVLLGQIPPSLAARYGHPCSPEGQSVSVELGRAYAGLGLILEFVAHQVIAETCATSNIPVQITGIEVGPGRHGREIVSFDLSEYGDPLNSRHIRLPFSAYLKPRRFEWALGKPGADCLLPIFAIPLSGSNLREALTIARSTKAATDLARVCSTEIPDHSLAMHSLIDEYEKSDLAKFHRKFYSRPWEDTSRSIDLPLHGVPSCVRSLLDHPNDTLLKPGALQHVARVLTALQWEAREIAQLIYASYVKDCNWGDTWTRLDPLNRAIFYTRLFTGMIETRIDRLIDLNCVSHQEKGYCTIPDCRSNLINYQRKLLERRPT